MPHKRKSNKKRFDAMRAAYLAAHQAAQSEAIHQAVKYGTERDARSWASRGEKTRLKKLEERRNKVGDKIVDLITQESPRGEAWKSGVPTHYLYEKLPWEDVVRPADEPLSSVPPAAWGYSEADVRRQLKT